MMRQLSVKTIVQLLVISLLLAAFGLSVYAAPAAQSTTYAPQITSFTTKVTQVDRNALAGRTARIPVSWTTANRPVFANLVFEQILPDNSTVNVELPRVIPWVNSSGDGVAAPILPDDNAAEIVLRVRLYNMLTNSVYDERQIKLAVGSGGNAGSASNDRPTITSFTTCCPTISPAQLSAHSARVPVSWEAVNRPVTANLVFEQILADGSVVNVELPRENPWVNSSGDGVAAPIPPGGDGKSVRLRVRLIDMLNGRVYDQRYMTLSVGEVQPQIRYFTTSVNSVDLSTLAARTARVPVSWAVDNRPANANLVFEQILADGSVVNVELPRENPWVASSGNGVAAPYQPGGNAEKIRLQLRLVNLTGNTNLAVSEIDIPIAGISGNPPDDDDMVLEFKVEPATVMSGDPITVTWNVKDRTKVSVFWQHADLPKGIWTSINESDPFVPASGSKTVNAPEIARTVKFYLLGEGWEDRVITVRVNCHDAWFVTDAMTEEICPRGGASMVQASYQAFEHGFMVWQSGAIWVFPSASSTSGHTYIDTWDGSTPVTFDQEPPEGLFQPVNGFGKVWVENEDVRNLLGWATASEQGYSMQIQGTQPDYAQPWNVGTTYLRLPDNRVIRIEIAANSPSWANAAFAWVITG